MGYFNFARLVKKYSRPFTLITHAQGGYVGGVYQSGEETRTEYSGAIISMTENKLYQMGGTYTSQDRHLYMLEPLGNALKGAQVEFDGDVYNVEENRSKGNEAFTDVFSYTLKWVSAVDKPKTN